MSIITGNDYNRLQLLAFMFGSRRFRQDIDGPLVHARFRGPALSVAYALVNTLLGDDVVLYLPEAVGQVLDPRVHKDTVTSLIKAAGVSDLRVANPLLVGQE